MMTRSNASFPGSSTFLWPLLDGLWRRSGKGGTLVGECIARTVNLNEVTIHIYVRARSKAHPSLVWTAGYSEATNDATAADVHVAYSASDAYDTVCYAQYKRFSDGSWTGWTQFRSRAPSGH
jgi:hypothetical protein